MDMLLNIKSNWKIMQMEALIKKHDPSQDLSRAAVFEREVQAAQNVDWKDVQLSILDLKQEEGAALPTSFQARFSHETAKILEQVQSDMKRQLSLKRLKANYMVLLLQMNYLNWLKARQEKYLGEKLGSRVNSEIKDAEIDMPAIAQLLVEIMLKDPQCTELVQIKTLLVAWKKRQ